MSLTTEQVFTTSGVAQTWLASNVANAIHSNSGGMTNVAAPMQIKAIYALVASGFTGAGSSGQILIACDCVSGATSGGNIAGNVLFLYYAGGIAASGAVHTAQPLALLGLDYIVRSGLSTFVAVSGGTKAYTLNVAYTGPQI